MNTIGINTLTRGLLSVSTAGLVALSAASPALAQDRGWYGDRDGRDYGYNNAGNPRDAVRQCTWAAKRQASQYGRAEVTQIRDVDRNGRGYTVSGQLTVANRGWNSRDNWDGNRGWGGNHDWDHDRADRNDWRRGNTGWFRCRVEYGRVVDLDIRGLRR